MVAFFGLLLFASSFCFAWMAMARDLKRRGHGFLLRHLVSPIFATVVSGVVVALLSADSPAWWQWLLSLAIVGGVFVQAKGGAPAPLPETATAIISPPPFGTRTAGKHRETHGSELAELQVPPPALAAAHKAQPGHTDQVAELRQLCCELTADGTLDDEEIHALHRWLAQHQPVKRDALAQLLANHLDEVLADGEISVLESLDVLDLVEALAQGKSFADMQDWQALAPLIENEPPKVKRRPSRQNPDRVTGSRLDAIRFHYLNAAGEHSDRRVVVRVLDGEYFQGVCQARRALRTFRLDRVVGQVTSEDTGEIADPQEWARSVSGGARQHAANLVPSLPPLAGREVLVTGFAAAERERLERLAIDAGMIVRKSVTQNLTYMVAGSRAGPAKLAQATERGAEIITPEQLEALVAVNAKKTAIRKTV